MRKVDTCRLNWLADENFIMGKIDLSRHFYHDKCVACLFSFVLISHNSIAIDILFRARQSLAEVYQQIALAKLSPPQINFTGLSHFNNKVLYIDPVKDNHLDQLTRIAGRSSSILFQDIFLVLIGRNLSRNL